LISKGITMKNQKTYIIKVDNWGKVDIHSQLSESEVIKRMFEIADSTPGAIVTIVSKGSQLSIDLFSEEWQNKIEAIGLSTN